MSRVSNHGAPDVVLDNYRKVYRWKYGAIASSGNVFLMVYFCRLFLRHESMGQPIDLLQVANEAKTLRSKSGIPPSESTGNLFFTLPGRDAFHLYGLFIGSDAIDYEIFAPVSTRFSMRETTSDQLACHAFNRRLRPSFFFVSIDDFYHYHLKRLTAIFASHSAIDGLVTASFDVCMLNKETGTSAFWQMSETTRRLAVVELEPDGSDMDSGLTTQAVAPMDGQSRLRRRALTRS